MSPNTLGAFGPDTVVVVQVVTSPREWQFRPAPRVAEKGSNEIGVGVEKRPATPAEPARKTLPARKPGAGPGGARPSGLPELASETITAARRSWPAIARTPVSQSSDRRKNESPASSSRAPEPRIGVAMPAVWR